MRVFDRAHRQTTLLFALIVAGLFVALSLAVFSPIKVFASEIAKDISEGTVTCDDPDITYRITGEATNKNHVTVYGGESADKPVVIILDNLTITQSNKVDAHDAPITIESGYAVIKLSGTSHLTAGRDDISFAYDEGRAGICVTSEAHLTITSISGDGSSDGVLYAQGGDNGDKGYGGAGIGSNYDRNSGYITINGGTIYATGGKCSAGIGSGRDGICKNVTINGGTITATGRDKAAGIGAGNQEGTGSGGHTNFITINGGTITATGGSDSKDGGAGIGGSNGDFDAIAINGGTITATGGKGGAGIGGGSDSHGSTITITNATITATGGRNAAGIGSGNSQGAGDGGSVGSITITNSKIDATGGEYGAGIGTGGDGSVQTITITGGEINATGGNDATGIGAGHAAGAGSGGQAHHIIINDSDDYQLNLTATAKGSGAAGIGSAGQDSGDITIALNGGTINATGTMHGAGIGGGEARNGAITITGNGTINATGGFCAAAIGAGNQCNAGTITIKGDDLGGSKYGEGAVYAFTINCSILGDTGTKVDNNAAIIGSGDGTSEDISISNAYIIYESDSYWLNGAVIGTGHTWDMSTHDDGIKNISLDHVNFYDKGSGTHRGADIGAGDGSTVHHIYLNEVNFTGGTIGSLTPSQLFYDNGHVKSISITDSKIDARALGWEHSELMEDNSPKAAIGTSTYGGIDSITISGSEITAYGAQGGAAIGSGGAKYTGGINPEENEVSAREAWTKRGKVGSITIENSTVNATGSFGGAGIGSGNHTSVTGAITIKGSTVVADGVGSDELYTSAAGIGAGFMCGCGDINIIDSDVKAKGGAYAAGIGASGYEENSIFSDIMMDVWDESVGNITITNSTVEAEGGENAAGIGAGKCTHVDASTFTITDSIVTATGGEYGAGIGAGPETGAFQFGGDSGTIIIEGDSVVRANAGRGAAGIGGGFSGCANKIYINLTQDPQYYVWAEGGDGAAGIGAGCSAGNWDSTGKDAHNITIDSGFVYARGGVDMDNSTTGTPSEHHPWGHIGAGAGIGGGSWHGTSNVTINGGVIVAHAGTPDSASPGKKPQDIGSGGDNYTSEFGTGKSTIHINGGTVIAGLTDENDNIITGGSVKHQVGGEDAKDPKAKNEDKDRVFQNTFTIDTSNLEAIDFGNELFYKITLASTSDTDYGTNDIYAQKTSEGRGKVYLYLTETDEDEATADVKIGTNVYHYYGTSVADHNDNLLKMANGIYLTPDDATPVAFKREGDSPFKLDVVSKDDVGSGTLAFAIESGDTVVSLNDDESNPSMPGAIMALNCLETGTFKVTATAVDGFGSDLYWDAEASYTGEVILPQPTLVITEDPSKEYDGTPVDDPAVLLYDIDGVITENTYEATYAYYDSEGTALASAPTEPGSYSVTASVAATEDYEGAQGSRDFEITKGHLSVTITANNATYNGSPVAATLSVVTSSGVDVSSDYQLTYRQQLDDGTWELLTGAPANAGNYRASVAIVDSEHYYAAGASKPFAIAKATPEPADPTTDVYDLLDYPDGLTLNDVALKGGECSVPGTWNWVDALTTPLFEGETTLGIKFVPNDTTNYTTVASSVTVKVVDTSKVNWDITVDDEHVQEVSTSVDKARIPLSLATLDLKATVRDVNGAVASDATVTYAVIEGDDVLSVDSKGLATVKGAGKAWVKITVAGSDDDSNKRSSNPLSTLLAFLGANDSSSLSASEYTYLETSEVVRVTVSKGAPVINVDCPDKTYDGKAAEAVVSIDDSAYPVRYTGTPIVTYWQQDESGAYTLLESAPVEAGFYKVEVITPRDDNYAAAESAVEFVIYPQAEPDEPTNPDDPANPGDGSNDGSDSKTPDTGDTLGTVMGLFGVTLAAAIIGFVALRRRGMRASSE